jgi:hypothetical protein
MRWHLFQVRHILACAELYLPALQDLQQEQRNLAQQLQQPADAAPPKDTSIPLPAPTASTHMHTVLDSFASNLKKQHVLRSMLCALVCGELSSLQCAKAAVHSHPLFLDVHALVCVLVRDRMTALLAAGEQPRYVFQHRWQHTTDLQNLVLPQLQQQ